MRSLHSPPAPGPARQDIPSHDRPRRALHSSQRQILDHEKLRAATSPTQLAALVADGRVARVDGQYLMIRLAWNLHASFWVQTMIKKRGGRIGSPQPPPGSRRADLRALGVSKRDRQASHPETPSRNETFVDLTDCRARGHDAPKRHEASRSGAWFWKRSVSDPSDGPATRALGPAAAGRSLTTLGRRVSREQPHRRLARPAPPARLPSWRTVSASRSKEHTFRALSRHVEARDLTRQSSADRARTW